MTVIAIDNIDQYVPCECTEFYLTPCEWKKAVIEHRGQSRVVKIPNASRLNSFLSSNLWNKWQAELQHGKPHPYFVYAGNKECYILPSGTVVLATSE